MRLPLCFGLSLLAPLALAAPLTFRVASPSGAFSAAFNGRVVVYISKQAGEPRFGPDWFDPQPCYSIRVKGGHAGQSFTIDSANSIGFPGKLSELRPGEYTVQAVLDRSLGGRAIGESPGNFYSKPVRMLLNPATSGEISVVCDKEITEKPFVDTASVKGVRFRSALLSKFYGRDTYMRAAVVLPELSSNGAKFPVIYEIPGFGGTHEGLSGRDTRSGTNRSGQSVIRVVLDPDCPTGHCVFADSANNGPWGRALTSELIPYIEKTYPAIPEPWARFTRGHSSGGWSSLWLQVANPDFFGGCWSTSPDPVDFRQFQTVDIYAKGANGFRDTKGSAVPLAREGNQVLATSEQFIKMELPIRGEQLGSFDAVFSPKGSDGEPISLLNPVTGMVQPEVAKYWERYDIALILKRNWKSLEPKLRGKIHIYMGTEDTFYLDGAVRLLQSDMRALKAPFTIELLPGNHSTVMTPALQKRIDDEIGATIVSHKRVTHENGTK